MQTTISKGLASYKIPSSVKPKKLVKSHQFEVKIINEQCDFEQAFTAYKTIYQQSWKGEEFSFEFIEQVCLAAIAEDKLRLGLLYVDEEPAAAQIWFVQPFSTGNEKKQKHASIFKLAYNPKYQQFSVGSLLSNALTEQVISTDDVTSIEFGMGSEAYKKDWLEQKRQRIVYQVFNPQSFYGKLAIIRHLILPKLVKKLR